MLGSYFAELEPSGEHLLEWCAAQTVEITTLALCSQKVVPRDQVEAMDKTLYRQLRLLLTEGESLGIVRSLVKHQRGADTWRRLSP